MMMMMMMINKVEGDLPAFKTTLTHRYNDSKTIYKKTMEDCLRPSETILITRWTTEWQKLGNKNGKKNNSMGVSND